MKKSSLISLTLLSIGFVSCGDPSNIASGISSGTEVSSVTSEEGSSDGKASSTKVGASSSSKVSTSSGSVYWNTDIPYDSITDDRDDQVYRTVKIGTQTWLAENLNYTPELGYSWCYDRKTANCDTYGRLYDWNTAKTACPEGWSLPDSTDWNTLVAYAGGKVSAGVKLKAATTLWSVDKGTDAFGFSAIPSGLYDGDSYFDLGNSGTWWTGTSASNTEGFIIDMLGTSAATRSTKLLKTTGAAVRCIQDEVPVSSSVKASSSVKPTSSAKLSSSEEPSSSAGLSSIVIVSSPIQLSLTIPVSSSAKVSSANQPSSTIPVSSSAVVQSSSSYVKVTGTFLDTRNNKTYKTVVIGTQTWMAENLNYVPTTGSMCYANNAANCTTYGRLYTWASAKAACPSGWHLPYNADWNTLVAFQGGVISTQGEKLKAKSSLWVKNLGTDVYGFSALPGGYVDVSVNIGSSIGEHGYWWTASPDGGSARYRIMYEENGWVGDYTSGTTVFFSVRCIKD